MLLLAALLAGCVSKGWIAGRLAAPGDRAAPTTPVTLSFVGERFGNGGTLGVALPDGEEYSGRYLQITTAATADILGWGWGYGVGWGPYWADWGPWGAGPWYGPSDWTTFVRTYSGSVVATLFGSAGHTMRCRFQLASPATGMAGGGVGECETSDGRRIDAQF